MRTRLHPLLLGAATLLGACTSTTEVRPDQDALDAAAQFATLGSQAAGSGADPDVVSAYYGIAGALGRTGRISPVTVVIDGTPLDFLATAQQVETDAGPGCSTTASLCPLRPPLRSVVAWQKSDPRRVVQFTAIGGSASIGESISVSSSGGIAQVGSLLYFDGSGGVYRSTSGTVRIPDPVTSDTPCRTLPEGVVSASSAPEFGPCTRAEFTASVDGSVAPPPFTVRGNTATGTHTIVMASQPVHGARIVFPALMFDCLGCAVSMPPFLLPVNLRGGDLRSTLTASVTGSVVTFELRVTNPQTVPVTVQFSSGQQYDFRVARQNASTAWVWSADKLFTAALTSRTLAAGETVVYTATWTPAEHGSFIAEGWLTSTSHMAHSGTAFSVP